MRLDKFLTAAGVTRSEARERIRAGRVQVAETVVVKVDFPVPDGARVTLDGREIAYKSAAHLMLNKPAGCVTALSDKHFPTVFDCLPPEMRVRGLSAVGRLDRDVTGLLLFTTDGELAHRLISPKWTIEKIYRAEVSGHLLDEHIARMAEGLALSDFTARPARLRILFSGETSCGELTVTEGKFHQVKRMFEAVGCPVQRLERLSVGGVALDPALSAGQARLLTDEEIERLYALCGLESTQP